jgi:Acetyltransferase (GNAT) domain
MGPPARGVHRLGGQAELTGDGPLAELIADRGEAAQTADFFRSRAFYDAEGVTHTLRIENGEAAIALPLLVREIPGTERSDAISPYGYPGAAVRGDPGSPPEPAGVDWSRTGLVSVFARERLGHEPSLAGATLRSVVQIHDPARPRSLRSRFGEQIRRNRKLGYRVEVLEGPRTSVEERASFHGAYTETMHRAQAAAHYFFEPEYLGTILGYERSWLVLGRSAEGAIAAGAIAALSDGLLHYYLGGTAEAHLGDSPFKNVVEAMIELAGELEVTLNLGGGVRTGDGLEDFKRGFANGELPFHTHQIVCDPGEYERLGEGRAESGFFPRYRAAGE